MRVHRCKTTLFKASKHDWRPINRAMFANAKMIAARTLTTNYSLIRRTFRRVVREYRGSESLKHIGFRAPRTLVRSIWDAELRNLQLTEPTAVALHEHEGGIVISSGVKWSELSLVAALLHEALHFSVTVRKRWIGSCLDHICLQALGEEEQPDATADVIRRRYPLLSDHLVTDGNKYD